MTKKLARLLRADIQETSDLKSIAAMLAGKGRGGDTLLAHITPKEVGLLKEAGGAGTVNPDTGLLEFYDWSGGITGGTVGGYDGGTSSYYTAPASSSYTAQTYTPSGYTSYTDLPEIDDLTAYQDTAGGFINKENLPRYTSEGLNLPVNIPVNTPQLANQLYQMPAVATAPAVSNIGLQSSGPASAYFAEGAGGAREGTRAGTPDKPFLTNEQMVRLGLSGGLGIYGALQQKKALEQIGKSTGQQKDIAKPYQDEGRKLIDAAQRGELTPAGVQQFQAVKAQLAQGAESRGGVGVAQAVAQAEAFKNQLLQGQYDYGLKVSQIGDNIALGAIRTGMQLDQQLGQANMAFYSQLGALAAGVPTYRT
jgi:hypothetical protein